MTTRRSVGASIGVASTKPLTMRRFLTYLASAEKRLVREGRALGLPPRFGAGAIYGCPADFVLRNGRSFQPTEMTAEETAYVLDCVSRANRRFPMKYCYINSQRLMFDGDSERRLSYVEGYCRRAGTHLPGEHGWLALDGKVVDVTWRHEKPRRRGPLRDSVLGAWSPGEFEYFGVEMDRAYVVERVTARRGWGSMIDDSLGGWPLLHGDERWMPAKGRPA